NEESSKQITPNSPHFPDQLLNKDRDNGDVLIIDMSNSEHGLVASLLQDYFKIVNGGVIINPPIVIGIDK
ncbi:7083_t:CDS:2, partial [Entrophospora sp. SA101]